MRRWQPSDGEIEPQVKLCAVRLIEALGSWALGHGGAAAAAGRAATTGADPGLVRQAGALVAPADRAALAVIDAQYGGILQNAASVLVVCRQWLMKGNSITGGGTTVDVRLRRASGRWQVTALYPAQPGPPDARLSALAASVLQSDRIELPPASRADVRSGRVHDSVLQAMLRLARTYRLGISVIRSGHPINVFGTQRPK